MRSSVESTGSQNRGNGRIGGMDIRIKTADYQLAPEISSYLDDKLGSLEKMLGEEAHRTRLEVELGRDAGRPRHGAHIFFAEIHVIIPGTTRIYARNNGPTLNVAIDDVKEEIERQLRREKKLHIRMYRKTGAALKSWMRLG